ncbi:uncharacterized protein TRIADDRAFT_20827, partial [Trichoplax adhaerens]
QKFSYVIIIDFEATCWKDNSSRYSSEIIEFPAVLLNVLTQQIEAVFHQYVQPTINPKLSEFCKTLTGITQKQVDDGIPLATCLVSFRKWLDEIIKNKNIRLFNKNCRDAGHKNYYNCIFVTWSDWDIGVCLYYECKKKQIKLPTEFYQWIDLRALYKRFYGKKPTGLNGSMESVGLKFIGREHSGLDDSKNTARLCSKMVHDGCVLDVTKRIALPPVSRIILDLEVILQ